MNGQSPINLDAEEQQYLELTKEYRQYDEIRFKAHRQKWQNEERLKSRSVRIPASKNGNLGGLDTYKAAEKQLASVAFRINLEETIRPSIGSRVMNEQLSLNFNQNALEFPGQERSISPIEKHPESSL